jgi:large subunit ribosomal protein L10
LLKAAFINGDVFVGNDQLKALIQIKTKNELIGEVIGLLQSPIQRVLGALQNKDAEKAVTEEAAAPVAEVATEAAPVAEAQVAEAPVAEAPAAETAPEAPATEEAKGEDETPQA